MHLVVRVLLLVSETIKQLVRAVFPRPSYRRLVSLFRRSSSRRVRWGNLRRLAPISRIFGFDRGQPIDRYYIERFLEEHSADIRGRVLEIGDPGYTEKYGKADGIRSDVLHAVSGNPTATLVGDLGTGEGVPVGTFDCMILTQTVLFICDVPSAIANAFGALRPSGVLLATFPGISQISRYDADRWGDYWRFTPQSAARLFGDVFDPDNIEVRAHGNVLVACAFLHGLAAHELTKEELDYHDPDYPVLITVRAIKRGDDNES